MIAFSPKGQVEVAPLPTGAGFSVFAETFSKFVLPKAAQLGISASTASRHCSVQGQFDDERTTIAYCMAYVWRHYASFKTALDVLGLRPEEFGRRLLIVDVGCGPGTALVAFGEWLHKAREDRSGIRYVGIERSAHMRTLAALFAADATLFLDYMPLLLPGVEDVTPEIVATQSQGCDELVLTMSYVLHQDFMADGQTFANILRGLSAPRLPIWLLAQDANKPHVDETNVESWPDTRLRAMLNGVEPYGYRVRCWSKRFEAKHYLLDEHGNAAEQPAEGRKRTVAIAARLEPA
jgi:SAM-dependent methyltransferase